MTLTKAARFGLYALGSIARAPGLRLSAGEVARKFGVSENHVAKVLQQLKRQGMIRSVRGVGGGYELAADPRRLTMLEVVECVEGSLLHQACDTCPFRDEALCPGASAACAVHQVLAELASHAYYTPQGKRSTSKASTGRTAV